MARKKWTPRQIRMLRDRQDLTQTQLADVVGVRQATISDWESGRRIPSRMACRRLDDIDRDGPLFRVMPSKM